MERCLKTAQIRGLETAWLESGPNAHDKPILLLLHGYPDNADSWNFQIEHFATHFHVVVPYGRGARPSAKSHRLNRYGHTALALDHLQILQKIDPSQKRRVICVGHDLGAVQAWQLAPLLGQRLAGLVIINGLNIHQMWQRLRSNPRQHLKSWYMYAMLVPILPEKLLSRYPAKALQIAHNLGGLSLSQRPKLSQALGSLVNPINQYRAYIRGLPNHLRQRPRQLNQPLLILWGDHDRFLVTPTMDEMEPYSADCTIRILQGNHWLHREQPQQVNTLLTDFFAKLDYTYA